MRMSLARGRMAMGLPPPEHRRQNSSQDADAQASPQAFVESCLHKAGSTRRRSARPGLADSESPSPKKNKKSGVVAVDNGRCEPGGGWARTTASRWGSANRGVACVACCAVPWVAAPCRTPCCAAISASICDYNSRIVKHHEWKVCRFH
jgi:hypothetical protein